MEPETLMPASCVGARRGPCCLRAEAEANRRSYGRETEFTRIQQTSIGLIQSHFTPFFTVATSGSGIRHMIKVSQSLGGRGDFRPGGI